MVTIIQQINRMNQKSPQNMIRNTYNFETAHQKQAKQAKRGFERVLIQPLNLNANHRFTNSIQQLQSKIEGVENLMRMKATLQDQNRQHTPSLKTPDYHFQTSKNKIIQNTHPSVQSMRASSDALLKGGDCSPIRKSYRLAQPHKYTEESPVKIPPLNLHAISTPPAHQHNAAYSFASTNSSLSPQRKLQKGHQSKSFMELPEAEGEKGFGLKLNGSFMCGIKEEERGSQAKQRGNEISLFDISRSSNKQQTSNENTAVNTGTKQEGKATHDLSYLSIKSTISKMKNRSKSKGQAKTIIKGFQFGRVLGKGKFGEVYLAKHVDTGFLVAIKKVVKKKLQEFNMVNQFIAQVKLHSSLDHPTIVKFYGFFEVEDSFYLVLEYINGGTLFEHQNQVGVLGLRQTAQFLKDIIDALAYLHERSIAHRDIKPENIVITNGIAKLCDFGWSAVVQSVRSTFCGTLDYAPPEIIERKSYDCTVDLWSIGILTYELLVGKAPFQSNNRQEVMNRIVNIDKSEIPLLSEVPAEAKEFIEALLQKDPARRPKIGQLLQFELFNSMSPTKLKKDRSFFK